ncbi:hypothetical protein NDU88_005107 [Pleurodeles waltl]|uniref:Uncharacterized protein n=1 Tax=Pleurodeles waltl TaxID=8319 RepID=A0AAV7RKL1_PLEWA|nr:hypothetical protein NDU88_005107 [Pleurodeles waltl]
MGKNSRGAERRCCAGTKTTKPAAAQQPLRPTVGRTGGDEASRPATLCILTLSHGHQGNKRPSRLFKKKRQKRQAENVEERKTIQTRGRTRETGENKKKKRERYSEERNRKETITQKEKDKASKKEKRRPNDGKRGTDQTKGKERESISVVILIIQNQHLCILLSFHVPPE